jgi:RNA polymerase sigma factor (TIGR02999 family)
MTRARADRALLAALRDGDPAGTDALVLAVYDELRRLAHHHLRRERPGHTLQTTALVHEVYLRLIPQDEATWTDRGKFIGVAAHLMREVLVDYARARSRAKRGGGRRRVPLEEDVAAVDPAGGERWEDLDRALDRLGALEPRQVQVVELRYFAGLTVEETADVIGVSAKTVKRDWAVARAWLRRELSRMESEGPA